MHLRSPRRRSLAALALVPALVLGMAACSQTTVVDTVVSAPDSALPPEIVASLDGMLGDAIAKSKATGAIAGVWVPGVGTWTSAAGVAVSETDQPMTTDMHFRLGTGGTDAMTCSVVAALADEKVLDLDVDVATYLPTMPGIGGLTLRQLCQSTSGLADFATNLMPSFVQNPARQWANLELIANGQAHPATAAGAYSPSATGYLLASLVATAKTGSSIQALYEKYVTGPYGMTDTTLPSASTTELPSPHPNGYAYALAGVGAGPRCDTPLDVTGLSPSALGAAGGAVTTLDDLRTLVSGVVNAPTSDQLFAGTVTMDSEWQRSGLGVSEMGSFRGFNGSAPGFVTAAYTDPDSGITVAVTLNNSAAGAAFAKTVALGLIASVVEAAPAGATSLPALPWNRGEIAGVLAATAVCQ